jgi:hypothetical protein
VKRLKSFRVKRNVQTTFESLPSIGSEKIKIFSVMASTFSSLLHLELFIRQRSKDSSSVFGLADDMVKQWADIVFLTDEVTHPESIAPQQAAGNVPLSIDQWFGQNHAAIAP